MNAKNHTRVSGLACALALIALLATLPASAQYFGRNKVQWRKHQWSILRTDNFEVYFYEKEREAARDAARMAERAYDRLSRILNHDIEEKVPLILYASHPDFQESNVSVGIVSEGTGGFTEFLKRRVALPFTGSYSHFDHVLTHELVHAFQLDILWGNKERGLGNPFAYTPPLWVMEGTAEYLSQGAVDVDTQMWLRDGALQGYLTSIPELNYVGDIRVYRYGQAIFAYIGQNYGDETIGLLLKKLAHTRSMDRAVQDVLGMSLEKLSEDWTESVRRTYLPQIADHEKPEAFAKKLTDHEKGDTALNLSPSVSPDGSLMVFLSDRSLYNDLYLASAVDGKVLYRLIKGERREAFESLRFLEAAFGWAPDNRRIAFAAKAGARDALYIMDVRKKKILEKHLFDLDGILSPAWSPDGDRIAFVGLRGGRSDLYIVDVDGENLTALTNDRYMVRDPQFSPDGLSIAFVTDRGPETDWKNLIFGEARLAIYQLTSGTIHVLPDQDGKNISPFWSPDGRRIAYVSDRTGISNIYIRDLETHQDVAITDVLTGVAGLVSWAGPISVSTNGKRLLFTSFTKGGWNIYAMKDPFERMDDPEHPVPSGTPEAPPFVKVRRSPIGGEILDITELTLTAPDSASPSLAALEPAFLGADSTFIADDPLAAEVDTFETVVHERPEFGSDRVREAFSGSNDDAEERRDVAILEIFDETRDLPDTSSFEVRPYRPRFSVDYVSANGFFASNVGLAAQSLIYFSDVLGDQHIAVGADVYGSLAKSNLLLQYFNQQRKTNWGVSLFQVRNDFFIFTAQDDEEFVSQIYRGVELNLQRPFSRFRRLEFHLQGLMVDEEVFEQSFDGSFFSESRNQLYFASPGIALVKDTALFGPTGPISGSRYRYSFDVALGDIKHWTAILDHREYLNIRRRYALAFRLIGGISNGRDPQIFRIGGPYTLRGYDFGELEGTRVGLMNLEFRFPLIEHLRLGWPLPLAFRGIRGSLFFDVGAAWDDTDSFKAFGRDPRGRWRLDNLQAAYGFGASLNFGFFILRWDLAQATDLSRGTRAARGELSFGADF
jgi:Tol biopolymer transport system component